MTAPKLALSCGTPPRRDLPELAARAESLGYTRYWTYDSPALYGDVWIALARVAERTERIGIGTAVAVPSLRHVMATASAIATLEELAPGRLACAFGTGFTARKAMGRKSSRWASLELYLRQLRGLLRGEVVEVEGAACQMIHAPGYAPPRPIEVPLLVAPMGPKGMAAARAVGDGVMLVGGGSREFDWCALMCSGTVLDPGEDHTSPRVREAAGPWFKTAYHAAWDSSPESVDGMPGGAEWRRRIEAERPEGERHLAVHEGHVEWIPPRERFLLDAAGPELLSSGWTGDADSVQARLARAAEKGVTEIVYMASGPDIPRELAAFADAAGIG
ncbi:MAG: LLM class flavin-dependent oxidoreductase [Proteobacteria bacterium]|nr:LLM class flavin-dependent oxidoreductase [Pseudomonadota bacterium]